MRKMHNKGYTLIELIVVIALLAILISITLGGLSAYIKYSQFKQNDEYARTLFSTIQTALTNKKSSGTLEDFNYKVAQNCDKVPEYENESGDVDYSRLYYLNVLGGKNTEKNQPQKDILRDLIGNYIYDEDIWNGSMCVELDPSDGIVKAVWYCRQADKLSYDISEASGGNLPIGNTDTAFRRKIGLGYYGTDKLSAAAPVKLGKPVISYLKLDNEEVLDLNWAMSGKYRNDTTNFTYNIKLFDEDGICKMLIVMDGSSLDYRYSGSTDIGSVECQYKTYDDTGAEKETGNIVLQAYIGNQKDDVHVLLDAIDINDKSLFLVSDELKGKNKYMYSTSGMRIKEIADIDLKKGIYARVQATGLSYNASSWKQSSVENLLMGKSIFLSGADFTIQNARHLNNIRFVEDSIDDTITYKQTEDFAWGGNNGIISRGLVFNSLNSGAAVPTEPINDENINFNKIEKLKENHSVVSSNKKIDELYLVYPEESNVALFKENAGKIEGLTLTNFKAEGKEYVASFCSENSGIIKNLSVESGEIKGISYVGGILAKENNSNNIEYDSLRNGADIYGSRYIGGIIGKITQGDSFGQIINCENTGLVSAVDSPDVEEAYIGGIAGYSFHINFENCVSSPSNENIDINENTDKETIEKLLIGDYVGGIVGCAEESSFSKCETGKGYIFGRNYVGGIVGVNLHNNEDIDGSKLLNKRSNSCMVLGKNYVGGIVGIHAGGEIGNFERTEYSITNWTNKGVVCATEKYAGGITGYNYGRIEKCSVQADTSSISGSRLLAIAEKVGGEGSYIGGVAGYNKGTIEFSNINNESCVTAGKSYVGGVVGFNDAEAYVDECSLDGGYISGKNYVGGMFGLNASVKTFDKKKEVIIKTNIIKGDNFVGGYIGANILPAENLNKTVVNKNTYVNNFLGNIESTGDYTGGLIGYNSVVDAIDISSYSEKMAEAKNSNLIFAKADMYTENEIIIQSSPGKNTVYLEGIKGSTNIGGIVGGNSENTNLKIINCKNVTSLLAEDTIEDNGENYAYCAGIIGRNTKYSVIDDCDVSDNVDINHNGKYYGVLTEVNEGTIRNCNSDSGHSFGDSSISNIGYFAGKNINVNDNYDQSGYIYNCTFNGIIIGCNNVGGITGVNMGKIQRVNVNGTITGYGENIGGITGSNIGEYAAKSEMGYIAADGNKNNEINCTITGEGNNAGGAVGLNSGIIGDGAIVQGGNFKITGNYNVGGFIGKDISVGGTENAMIGQVSQLVNNTGIEAKAGNAGGIIGSAEGSGFMLAGCENNGEIKASTGNAGGITAFNNEGNTVYNCTNTANITAPKAESNGAIVGTNYGRISSCFLGSDKGVFGLKDKILLNGNRYLGGIAGENGDNAEIIDTVINCELSLSLTDADESSCIGAIAGINSGSIVNTFTSDDSAVTVKAEVNDLSIGGAVGYNKGSVDGGNNIFKADVMLGSTISAPIGGIAGINNGEIRNYTYRGKITADGGADYGIGGIAGVNGSDENSDNYAVIEGCKIDDGISRKLTRASSTNVNNHTDSTDYTINTTLNESVRVGGIAGYNCKNGIVRKSTLANCYIKSDYGYTGGIVGHNYGVVEECKADTGIDKEYIENLNAEKLNDFLNKKPALNVKLYKFNGDLGGIVGRNEASGQVNNCSTGRDWYILVDRLNNNNVNEGTDNTCAGAIGYNCSDYDIDGLENSADVAKYVGNATTGSGIIGRQENITSDTFIIKNCYNYGDAVTTNRAAGIISQWKYNGGTVVHCKNYGSIRASGTAASGIVASFYGLSKDQNVTIAFCDNLGSVGKSENGGIVGDTNGANSANIYIYKCANAGEITGTQNSGGIIGRNNTLTAVVEKSVNYYRFGNDKEIGHIAGNASKTTYTDNINIPLTKNNSFYVTKGYTLAGSSNSFFGGESDGSILDDTLPVVNVANKISLNVAPGTNNWNTGEDVAVEYLWDGVVSKNKGTAWKAKVDNYDWAGKNFTFTIDVRDKENKGNKIGNVAIATQSGGSRPRYHYFNISFVTGEGTNQLEHYLKNDGTITTNKYDSDIKLVAANEVYDNIMWTYFKLKAPIDNVNTINIKLLDVRRENGGNEQYAVLNEIAVNKIDSSSIVSGVPDELILYKMSDGKYKGVNLNQGREIPNIPYNPNNTDNKTASAKNDGRTYYADINTVIMDYFRSLMNAEPTAPENVLLEMSKGKYTLTWDKAQGGYKYRAEVLIYANGEWKVKHTEDIEIGTSYSFRPEDEWFDENAIAVKCRVYTINGLYDDNKSDEENAEYISDPSESNEIALGNVLPTPKITYELTDMNGTYVCRLLNTEDYAGYDTSKIIIVPGATNNVFSGVQSFTVAEGKSNPIKYSGGTLSSSFYVSAFAKATGNLEGKVIDSVSYYAQTQIYGISDLKNKAFTEFAGDKYFTGIDPTELKLNATLKADSSYQNYRYTELVYNDMVYDTNYMRVTASHKVSVGGMKTISYGEPVTLRSYPAGTQNMGISYGHIAEEGVTWETASYYLNTSGYSVRSIADTNTYDVYYNVLLDNKNIFGVQILEYNTSMPKGVESVILSDRYINENNIYTFSWTDPNGSDGKYNVSIKGTKSEGGIDVYTLIYNNETEDKSITVNGSNWDYNKIKVEVSRTGQADDNRNETINMGSYAERVYDVSLNLPALNKPSVKLVNKDDVKYTVAWKGYNKGTAEYNDTLGYEIHIYGIRNGESEAAWVNVSGLLDKDSSSTVIDLEPYSVPDGQEEQTVKIAVIAKIVSSPKIYGNDSLPSLTQSLSVPSRKNIEGLSVTISPTGNDTVSMSEFENTGFVLSVKNNNTEDTGRYVVKADVYADENGGVPTYVISNMNSDSPKLYSMTNENGNSLKAANYVFKNIPMKCAGQYLYVSVRSTSDSGISSGWSEVYKLKLPMVRLNKPDIVQNTDYESYDVFVEGNNAGNADVLQRNLNWLWDEYAKGYNILITGINGEKHNVSINKTAEGYSVICDGNQIENTPLNDDDNRYAITDYSCKVSGNYNNNVYSFDISAILTIRNNRCYLILPDYESYILNPGELSINEEGKNTRIAEIYALPENKNYSESESVKWERDYSNGEYGNGTIK